MAIELNDETLGAYLDDELDASARAAFETALAASPEARQRLERLRAADARLKEAFPLQRTPNIDPLAKRILAFEPETASRPARRRNWSRRMTAMTTLAAGIGSFGLAYLLTQQRGDATNQDENRNVSAVLAAALDGVASGEKARTDTTITRLVLSFRAADGRYCRVFEQDSGAASSDGLACRQDDRWQLLAFEAGAAGHDTLHPAGGSAAVDQLMDRLGGAPALEPAQEKALIDHHWAAPQP